MPSSRPRRRKGHGEVMPPLSVFERVQSLLKEHLAIFPSKPELTESEIDHWHQDLSRYSIQAIEYAFDNWRRNGRFFPVYADIIELCEGWEPNEKAKPVCSEECLSRHGRGYGQVDVMKLWQLNVAERAKLGRPLNDSEWYKLYDVIDEMRGQAPAWRA